MKFSDIKGAGTKKWMIAALLAGLLALSGCVTTTDPAASATGTTAEASTTLAAKGQLTPDQQAEIVKKRFQERWDAMIAKDYAKAYTYLSPATRALVSEAQFTARFSKGNFKKAELRDVKCEEDVCMVRFILTYDHASIKGISSPTGEKWFFRDGEAWINLPE